MIKLKDIINESNIKITNEGVFDGLKRAIKNFQHNQQERLIKSKAEKLVKQLRNNVSKVGPGDDFAMETAISKSELGPLTRTVQYGSKASRETIAAKAALLLFVHNQELYDILQWGYHVYLENDWVEVEPETVDTIKADILKLTTNSKLNWKEQDDFLAGKTTAPSIGPNRAR